MINAILQDVLAKRIEEILKGYQSKKKKDELTQFHVYIQDPPIVTDRNSTLPYVAVFYDNEVQEEKETKVQLYLIIGIFYNEKDKQGHRELLNVFNLISQTLLKEHFLAGKYEIQYPIKFQIQEEDLHPEYYGVMETNWKIPTINKIEEEWL